MEQEVLTDWCPAAETDELDKAQIEIEAVDDATAKALAELILSEDYELTRE